MITVRQIHKEDWKIFSEKAHLACFSEHRPSELDRIDFALLVEDGERLMGYLACKEYDAETLYWQFGGAFKGTRDTCITFHGYKAFVQWSKDRYKRIFTLIENTNGVMLKMAWKVGFKIVGTRVWKNTVLVEHELEFADVAI